MRQRLVQFLVRRLDHPTLHPLRLYLDQRDLTFSAARFYHLLLCVRIVINIDELILDALLLQVRPRTLRIVTPLRPKYLHMKLHECSRFIVSLD